MSTADDEFRPEGMFTTSEEEEEEEESGEQVVVEEEKVEYKLSGLAHTTEGKKMLDRVIERAVEQVELKMNEVILQCKAELKEEKMRYSQFESRVEREREKMKEMKKRNDTLLLDLVRRQEEIEALKESLRASMEERRTLTRQNEEKHKQITSLELSEADLKKRLKTSYFDTERLHIQVSTLREMKEYLSKEWQEAEKKLNSNQDKVKIAEMERDDALMKLREAKLFKEYLENESAPRDSDEGIQCIIKTKLRDMIRDAETYQLRSSRMKNSRPL